MASTGMFLGMSWLWAALGDQHAETALTQKMLLLD
jgi:hypothetical protein